MLKSTLKSNVFVAALAILTSFMGGKAKAISLDDIQLWTGSGTNRAALVVEWSVPESLTDSSVPIPVTDKTLVWGYRFNGSNSASQMLNAIVAADPKLYVVEQFGDFVTGIGYNLNGNGVIGVTDGSQTNFFTGGFLTDPTVDVDAAAPLNPGDLYWGGLFGPNWETWNETNDAGGLLSSPNRGSSQYWTPEITTTNYGGFHGQWEFAQSGLDGLQLSDGSWIGFSVAAGEFEEDTNAPYNAHKHAPPSPDGTYVAYVCNTNDFAVQIVSTSNLDPVSPYNDPTAVLNRPTLKFVDVDDFATDVTERVKIVEPPYNVAPDGSNVITEIRPGGQMTVKLGRKVYDNPDDPYGIDLIVYGNSFFVGSGFIGDETDLNTYLFGNGIFGHPTTVSVSQDGTNWFSYSNAPTLFPDNAYRWDDTNASWTDEEMNPTKPLNPFIYTNNYISQPTAGAMDQFIGASGGSGYDLSASGLPWIQYVRVTPGAGTYTVIDAFAAVQPAVVGDALSIAPDNLAAGITRLAFQSQADFRQNQIAINFNSVNEDAKVSTVSLNGFSSFAPVIGNVLSAYQIQSRPVIGTNAVVFQANLGLRAGGGYSGGGNDVRVYQWNYTNWVSQPFVFNPTNHEALVAGVTNFSAFVVSQIVPPNLSIQALTNGFAFQFVPVPNCPETFQRSIDLVTWTPLSIFTATNAQPITLQDTNVPAGNAFYRVQLTP